MCLLKQKNPCPTYAAMFYLNPLIIHSTMRRIIIALLCLLSSHLLLAQTIAPSLLNDYWKAGWISCPGISQRAYGVYHFRKTFDLPNKPDSFVIHLSADNRYRLFVNGEPVCSGPARGDLAHWNFETINIAPYLHSGNNTLAAEVWNMGEYAAVAQVSNQTAFVVQGDGKEEELVNTNNTWKVYADSAYAPCSVDNGRRLQTYMVIGPGDSVRAGRYPWGWQSPSYNDTGWRKAVYIAPPVPHGVGSDNIWTLTPRTIPLMEETQQRILSIRRIEGMKQADFIKGSHPVTLPPHSTVRLLLDQTFNTVAYPQLAVSGGKGSLIKLSYAEALFDTAGDKGNRNEIEGKTFRGNYDVFLPDGGANRMFRPLWFRTYRYMQVEVTTGDEPLVIEDLYGMYTGYPFKQVATFQSSDTSLQSLWNVGWRTARLCAGETYFDCPYYEQLQYEADTRIQSLISLYVTGDDRLMRKAITDFYNSRVSDGLTQGRYPSSRLQVIPPFSLFWVSMLYDYTMHRRDDAFIKQNLQAVKGVLYWYEQHIDTSRNMLGAMNWWNFADWASSFPGGTPPGANDGNSAVITLQYAYTLQQAAALFSYFKQPAEAAHYAALAAQMNKGTYAHCFNKTKEAMGDTPEKRIFSQHASIMAILSGCLSKQEIPSVMKTILYDTSLTQATFYYRFYLVQALKKAGMANLYYSQLTPWRDMIQKGLTTFAENPDPTRSDCHAWSASPLYDFLATLCGITPASPGFRTITIAPAFGELTSLEGSMPHPDGTISVSLARKDSSVKGLVMLPANVKGNFIWKGKTILLHGGRQEINL